MQLVEITNDPADVIGIRGNIDVNILFQLECDYRTTLRTLIKTDHKYTPHARLNYRTCFHPNSVNQYNGLLAKAL